MVTALQAGYATAFVDTGHKSPVTPQASFVPGHPEKLVDFAYRAAHEMAVQGKALIAAPFALRSGRLSLGVRQPSNAELCQDIVPERAASTLGGYRCGTNADESWLSVRW